MANKIIWLGYTWGKSSNMHKKKTLRLRSSKSLNVVISMVSSLTSVYETTDREKSINYPRET